MNYVALRTGLQNGGIFWSGFLLGAHKYHLLYYLPVVLNPQLRCVKPWDTYNTGEKVLAHRATYYKELQRKMAECE